MIFMRINKRAQFTFEKAQIREKFVEKQKKTEVVEAYSLSSRATSKVLKKP